VELEELTAKLFHKFIESNNNTPCLFISGMSLVFFVKGARNLGQNHKLILSMTNFFVLFWDEAVEVKH